MCGLEKKNGPKNPCHVSSVDSFASTVLISVLALSPKIEVHAGRDDDDKTSMHLILWVHTLKMYL